MCEAVNCSSLFFTDTAMRCSQNWVVQSPKFRTHLWGLTWRWTICGATLLLEHQVVFECRWSLSENHQTAHVLEVGLHCQRHAELLREEVLCGHLAWVHTKACAPAGFEVPAFLDLDAAFHWFIVYRHLHNLTRADKPWEEKRRDAGVKLSSPVWVWEQLSKPVWHFWKTSKYCGLLFCCIFVPRQSMRDFHHPLVAFFPAPWWLPACDSAESFTASVDEHEIGKGVLVLPPLSLDAWFIPHLCTLHNL